MAKKLKINEETYKAYWDEAEPKTILLDYRDLRARMSGVPPWHIGNLLKDLVDSELGIIDRGSIRGDPKNKNLEAFKNYLLNQADKSRREYIRSYLCGKFKSKDLDEVMLQEVYAVDDDGTKDNLSSNSVDNFLQIWGEETGFIVDASAVAPHIKKIIKNFVEIGLDYNYDRLRKMIKEQGYKGHQFANFVERNWMQLAQKSL